MANREKGESSVRIGEKTYRLVLNFHAWALTQDALTTGNRVPSIEQIMTRMGKGHFLTAIAVFWAGLQKHHPEIETLDKATELMVASEGAASRAIIEALDLSTADVKDAKELEGNANPQTAQASAKAKRTVGGTGVDSTVTPVTSA